MIREQKLYGGKVMTFVKTAGDSIRRVEAICLDESAGTHEFMIKDWDKLMPVHPSSVIRKPVSFSNDFDEYDMHDDFYD